MFISFSVDKDLLCGHIYLSYSHINEFGASDASEVKKLDYGSVAVADEGVWVVDRVYYIEHFVVVKEDW